MEARYQEIPEAGFHNSEDFAKWLSGLEETDQIQFGPTIAIRAALRGSVCIQLYALGLNFLDQTFEATASGLLIARTAFKRKNQSFLRAIDRSIGRLERMPSDAAIAVQQALRATTGNISQIAGLCLESSGRSVHASFRAVEKASENATTDFWRAVSSDAFELSNETPPDRLLNMPVWDRGAPNWWLKTFENLKSDLYGQSSGDAGSAGWEVFINWMQCRIDGTPSWHLPSDASRDLQSRIALGDGRDDFWDREPDVVNAEILGWLNEAARQSAPEGRVIWPQAKSSFATPKRKGRVEKLTGGNAATERAAAKLGEANRGSGTTPPKKRAKAKSSDEVITIAIKEIPDLAKPGATAREATHPPPETKRADLEPLADTVDGSVDHLGRANIAYALAGRINEVWDQMNKAAGAAPGFVIHIDAPWGGGKSTFAEYIAQILNPYTIKGPLPGWLKALPIGKDGTWPERFRRPWHIVKFNAWQHQHVTPPWWVFYETIRETVTKQQAREGNHQSEALPAPLPDFAFMDQPWRWLRSGLLQVKEYVWRLFSPSLWFALIPLVLTVLAIYLLVKLGVIQTVQKDGKFEIGLPSNATGFIATTAGVILGGGAALWRLWSAFTQTLLPGTPDAAKNFSLGSGDPLKRMKKHFVSLMEEVHRPVLVIVDDLDRCDPAFVVELVRGMQTILASPRVVYLLLGDRDWIEQSFTEVHKAMKGVEVGPEHRFGGRFVEKAIQFSMVLPDVSEQGRQDYVRQLLTSGGTQAAPAPVTAPPSVLESVTVPEDQRQVVEALKAEAKEVLETNDYEQREQKAKSLADKYDLDLLAVPRQEFEQEMAQKLFFRAATDSTAERATKHMIEGMASILPANPRQIKRIINTLSLLGQVLRITDPAKRPGSADWQLLARWVVLMVEWPKSWFTLSRHPGLTDVALAIAEGKTDAEIAEIEMRNIGFGYLPPGGMRSTARLIAANSTVMRALNFLESEWEKRPITAAEIVWLRQVMPAASGQVLQPPQQEKPASADTPPAGKAA